MKGKRRKWMMGALIVALLLSACQEAASPAAVQGPLAASGTIRADEVRVASELGGRIVEVRARVGETVQAGDELVTLDATSLLAMQAEAEAAVAAAKADLAVVRAGPRVQETAAAQAALALAKAGRDGLLAAWKNALEAVENPQELDAQISEARTRLELAA
ncbi:MAG: biotin/lipoyl-binding protein, partial [Delftia sp.]|nr:biotin/lipoyl-binding protein [Delftia sp.]